MLTITTVLAFPTPSTVLLSSTCNRVGISDFCRYLIRVIGSHQRSCNGFCSRGISGAEVPAPCEAPHPGGNPGANLKSISHRCHPILVAFVWELTEETIHLPLGCLQGGQPGACRLSPRPTSWPSSRRSICEAGSYLRLIDSCITQLKAQGPSRTCNESKEEGASAAYPHRHSSSVLAWPPWLAHIACYPNSRDTFLAIISKEHLLPNHHTSSVLACPP